MKFRIPNIESLNITFEEGEFEGQTIHFSCFDFDGRVVSETYDARQIDPNAPRKERYIRSMCIRAITGDELTRMTQEILAHCATLPDGAWLKKLEFIDRLW